MEESVAAGSRSGHGVAGEERQPAREHQRGCTAGLLGQDTGDVRPQALLPQASAEVQPGRPARAARHALAVGVVGVPLARRGRAGQAAVAPRRDHPWWRSGTLIEGRRQRWREARLAATTRRVARPHPIRSRSRRGSRPALFLRCANPRGVWRGSGGWANALTHGGDNLVERLPFLHIAREVPALGGVEGARWRCARNVAQGWTAGRGRGLGRAYVWMMHLLTSLPLPDRAPERSFSRC